jgi:hypothetical protein
MTDTELLWAMRRLNVQPTLLSEVEQGQTFADRLGALQQLQADTKRAFKAAALELHPDRTGGDVEKAEEFKRLATFTKMVLEMGVRKPEPRVIGKFRTTVRFTAAPISQ